MDCLLGLRAGLRAEVQEVRAGRRRPAPRGAELRPRRRVDRLHDRPADQAQQRGPARGRQGHVPALQPDAADEDRDGRQGRRGPGEDDRPDPEAADRRRDAGARRARRPRQEGARPRSPRSTSQETGLVK